MARTRLDSALVDRRLAETRARAQSLILGGGVTVDGQVVTRPATQIDNASEVALVREPLPYVSRGGLKLRHALDEFDVVVDGRVAADVGASTGGFTDVLLQAGARRVFAIDVGYGQLAWKLRQDERVVVMERTNVRYLDALPEAVDLVVIDVSFISLRLVLPVARRLLRESGDVVCLIKPQFEAGREKVGRKGVVRDPGVWAGVIRGVLTFAESVGLVTLGLTRSPIAGPAGNIEFLAHLRLTDAAPLDWESRIMAVTAPAAGREGEAPAGR